MNEVSFEIEGKKYSLYFGMDAYEIIIDRQLADTFNKEGTTFKATSYIIYGGLVNNWILQESPKPSKPTYKEAYEITQSILILGDSFKSDIWDVYNGSIASELLKKAADNASGNKKKVEGLPKKASKRTGSK